MKQIAISIIAVVLLCVWAKWVCKEKPYSSIIEASCSHGNTASEWGRDSLDRVLDKELPCGCRIRGQVAMRDSYFDLPPRVARVVTNEPGFVIHIMK